MLQNMACQVRLNVFDSTYSWEVDGSDSLHLPTKITLSIKHWQKCLPLNDSDNLNINATQKMIFNVFLRVKTRFKASKM